jgi:hypothetical protein
MKTCEHDGQPLTEPRSHPWQGSALDPAARYHDFTEAPALIRSSLEDFAPYRRYPAVEEFYALLERVNHPKSALESNDCAFSGPHPSESEQAKQPLECSGRLMLLYRALELNTLEARVAWLRTAFHYQLAQLDPKFSSGVIGTTLVPVRYLALPEQEQLGQQLMLSFWTFGDTEASVMQSLARLFKNLSQALRGVSARII